MKKHFLSALITLAFGFLYFYVAIPAIHFRDIGFWFMLLLMAVVYLVCYFLQSEKRPAFGQEKNISFRVEYHFSKKVKTAVIFSVVGAALVIAVIFVSSSPIFRAKEYQSMLHVEEADFVEDIAELPISQIPIVDRDTAARLGSRKIGEVVELVSQFNVSSYYTQINYNEAPYRVSPLEYDGILKWFTNREEGIPYYVTINMATQETELVELEEGMKYSPSEYFSRDLYRHIRFQYPTRMFEELSFEIDDSGHPYWVMSYYDYTIGLFGGKDIQGVILVDAVTGEMTDYPVSGVPQWIDRVYPAPLVVEQADNWGSLKNGFFNSIFAQKNVIVTTEGYNYIAVDDDVWLYTGLTSVVADESNIGFILVNMRTKEAKTYAINGAEEYSAMESAEGKIQEKGYNATFPILINVQDTPSYFISLKDNAGLVKAYAFVSVTDYQVVGVADTIADARSEYLRMLGTVDNSAIPDSGTDATPVTGTVSRLSSAVINGNSVYYLEVDGKVYTANVGTWDYLPLLREGDTVSFLADVKGKIREFTEAPAEAG